MRCASNDSDATEVIRAVEADVTIVRGFHNSAPSLTTRKHLAKALSTQAYVYTRRTEKLAQAAEICREVTEELDAACCEGWLRRGEVNFHQENTVQAQQELEEAIKHAYDRSEIDEIEEMINQWSEVEPPHRDFMDRWKRLIRLFVAKLTELADLKVGYDPGDAIALYCKSLHFTSDRHSELLTKRSIAYLYGTPDLEAASRDAQAAVDKNNSSFQAWKQLGFVRALSYEPGNTLDVFSFQAFTEFLDLIEGCSRQAKDALDSLETIYAVRRTPAGLPGASFASAIYFAAKADMRLRLAASPVSQSLAIEIQDALKFAQKSIEEDPTYYGGWLLRGISYLAEDYNASLGRGQTAPRTVPWQVRAGISFHAAYIRTREESSLFVKNIFGRHVYTFAYAKALPWENGAEDEAVPSEAKWTKVDRILINDVALEEAGHEYEKSPEGFFINSVLQKRQIQLLIEWTKYIRQTSDDKSKELWAMVGSLEASADRVQWLTDEEKQLEQKQAAMETVEPVIENDRNKILIELRRKAKGLFNQLDYRGAIRIYDAALKLDKGSAELLTNRSKAHMYLNPDGDKDALEDALGAVKAHPEYWPGWLQLGYVRALESEPPYYEQDLNASQAFRHCFEITSNPWQKTDIAYSLPESLAGRARATAIFLAARSEAKLKLRNYWDAEQDAILSIQQDNSYFGGWLQRGAALLGMAARDRQHQNSKLSDPTSPTFAEMWDQMVPNEVLSELSFNAAMIRSRASHRTEVTRKLVNEYKSISKGRNWAKAIKNWPNVDGRVPPFDARWTKIDCRLVSPEALEETHEAFDKRKNCVVVGRIVNKYEVVLYALRTKHICTERNETVEVQSADDLTKAWPNMVDWLNDKQFQELNADSDPEEKVETVSGQAASAPPSARWTKIDRRIVNPEALKEAGERFEERHDYVIVLRVLSKEEIQTLADRTLEIREKRQAGEAQDETQKDIQESASQTRSYETSEGGDSTEVVQDAEPSSPNQVSKPERAEGPSPETQPKKKKVSFQ